MAEQPASVAALVLAAGRGSRFAGGNKLLAAFRGRPLIRWTTEAALASQAWPVVVVVGHDAAAVEAALADLAVQLIVNSEHTRGLSTSLRAGLAGLPTDLAGALVLLADMPLLAAAHLDRLIAAFRGDHRGPVCVPVHEGRRGNPVLWPKRLFPALMRIEGDVGGRALIASSAAPVLDVPMPDPAVLIDVDDAEGLAALVTAGED